MEPKLLTAERFVDPVTGCGYRYVYSDTEYFRPHYHDYYELFVLLDGTVIHYVNGTEFLLRRGTAVFIRPADTHDYVCEDGRPFSMLNFTFTRETAELLFTYLGEGFGTQALMAAEYPPEFHMPDSDFKWFGAQMANIRAIAPDDTDSRKTAIRILLFNLFTKCFSDFSANDDSEMPEWLSMLCDEMRQNSNFTYGSARMFELTDRSREHVSRCLKKYTGMTVSEFINDLRLHFVANMLRNSNHSVSHILFESGFNNVSWASALFKQKYGMTMSEFRKTEV